jgi:hypothetical protein
MTYLYQLSINIKSISMVYCFQIKFFCVQFLIISKSSTIQYSFYPNSKSICTAGSRFDAYSNSVHFSRPPNDIHNTLLCKQSFKISRCLHEYLQEDEKLYLQQQVDFLVSLISDLWVIILR